MNSSNPCHIRLLGSPSIVAGDGTAVGGGAVQRHRIALLALLALGPGHGLSRERLLGYLWPENETERGRRLLNQAVYQIRRTLGEDAITSVGDELRLNADRACVDVAKFERAIADDDQSEAVALYQGPLLDGFYLSGSVEFERWAESERARLAGEFAKALETLAERAESSGDFRLAADWWTRRAAHDPFDSRVALRLMQSLETAGHRAGALQHAAQHARLLHEEFGIAPSAELRAFAERMRLDAAEAPAPVPRARRNGEQTPYAYVPTLPITGRTPAPPAPPAAEDLPYQNSAIPAPAPAHALSPRFRKLPMVLTAAIAGAVLVWILSRADDRSWLLERALPQIERYLDVADWESAYALTREAEKRIPGSGEVAELWPRLSWVVTIESEPAGARVFRQPYTGDTTRWEFLGRTPLKETRIPYGLSRIRLELDGYRTVLRALGGAHINWRELAPGDPDHVLAGPEVYRLDRATALPPDVVRVPGGTVVIDGDSVRLSDFLMGTYEVTNAEFKRFVDAGGYRRPELWGPIVARGDTIPWSQAMTRFVDRTGRPGPAVWEAGDYPTGEGGFPVGGVSWYEAAAYARFTGRELPTVHHWQQALANALFPWLLPASNFGGERARPVVQSRAMSHVEVVDLTGNVREWTATDIGSERIILGGSWSDPYYIAGTPDVSAPPEDRSPGNGLRLAIMHDAAQMAAKLRAPVAKHTASSPAQPAPPVPDEVYAAYSRVFDYDRSALDAIVESVDTTRVWIRERVTIDAGYDGERLPVYVYRPATGHRRYHTVVYWPGWDAFWLTDADEYFAKQLDFVVKSGRAVAFPIYRGTFERRVSSKVRRPAFGTADYRDNTIHTVKELRRTVDYLQARPDVDDGHLAFYGYSWGGVNAPLAIAQESRFRAAVIHIGLLPPMAATPEVDPVNSLPRVRVPTLMFSGEFDSMVPRENAARYFSLIGTPAAYKRHVFAIGGHFVPRDLVMRETLDWFDRYLGPTDR